MNNLVDLMKWGELGKGGFGGGGIKKIVLDTLRCLLDRFGGEQERHISNPAKLWREKRATLSPKSLSNIVTMNYPH